MSVSALVAAYDELAQKLFTQLAKTQGNIVLSPLSIGTAIAMVLAGARGRTEAEMRRVLGHELSGREIDSASATLIAALEGYGREDATHITIANALLLDETRGATILLSYRALLKGSFAAEILVGATPDDANAWVARKTMGLVPRLLDTVDELTVGLLLNAVFFAANWAMPFDPEETGPGLFRMTDGERVQVPMMQHRVYAPIVRGSGYRAVRVPFARPHLGLVLVVPDRAADLDQVGAMLDPSEQKTVFTSMGTPTLMALMVPRFRLAIDFDLGPLLVDTGLTLAFGDEADFSGMADPDPGVKIDQVRHAACIEVHEAGCVAAAATVVAMAARAMIDPDPEPFIVDRPFLYFLVDDVTGATIMRGRVVDPRG